jgi:hypothetical protein
MSSLGDWTNSQFDPTLDWESVEWIKKHWDGPLILKGVNDVEDAKIAADTGADAIDRLQPRRPPARRRRCLHRHAGADRRRRGRQDRGSSRFRHPLGHGHLQGDRARREIDLHRPRLYLRSRRRRRGGGDQGAADAAQGARHHHGAVWRDRHQQGRPSQSADAAGEQAQGQGARCRPPNPPVRAFASGAGARRLPSFSPVRHRGCSSRRIPYAPPPPASLQPRHPR